MNSEKQELVTLIAALHDIAQSYADAGYEDQAGIREDQVSACHRVLVTLGGDHFAESYLPFLQQMNGFDLNGVRLFGYFADKEDERDLRKQSANLHAVPDLFPDALKKGVVVGETDMDILFFNRESAVYEIRDFIGVERINERHRTITGLLRALIPLIE